MALVLEMSQCMAHEGVLDSKWVFFWDTTFPLQVPCLATLFFFQSWQSQCIPSSERRWVCWTAWQLLSKTMLTLHYHCYDTDAACGKLKVSLTASLPLPTHAHRALQFSEGGGGRKSEGYMFSFTASAATFKVLLICSFHLVPSV